MSEKRKGSLNTVAVNQGLEETHYPCHVTHQCRVREMKMAGEFHRLIRDI